MSIDEAIKHAREKADEHSLRWKHCTDIKDCDECGKEHKQLADWLEELKALKEENSELHNEAQAERAFLTERDAEIRAKAIDEFAEKLTRTFKCEELQTDFIAVSDVINIIYQRADQLKGGAV